MSVELGILDLLRQEAAKISNTDNPLRGAVQKSGDTVVGQLLEDELQLLRLAGSYHDQSVAIAGGVAQKFWSPETQRQIDRLVNLHQLVQDLVITNVMHRLGWKYFHIGYLEDGSIVTF